MLLKPNLVRPNPKNPCSVVTDERVILAMAPEPRSKSHRAKTGMGVAATRAERSESAGCGMLSASSTGERRRATESPGMMQLLFWTRYNDLTNSFKAYRSYVIRDIWPLKACHFNITIELSLNALIREYAIAQVPISWQGRTWGSSNLHLSEMGRRYLSTLLRAWFEKNLILDDLLAESVVSRKRSLAASVALESRVNALERRIKALEADKSA